MVAKDGVGTAAKSGSGGSATMSAYIAAVAQDRSWRISSALSWPAPMASNDGNAKPINPPAAGMIVALNPTSPASKRSARCWAFLILPRAAVTLSAASLSENAMHARPTPVRICSARSFHSRIFASAGSREQSKQLVTVNSTLTAVGVPSESSARIRHVPGIRLGPSMGWMMLPIPTMSLGDPQAGRSQLPSAGSSTVASTMQTRPPLMSEVT